MAIVTALTALLIAVSGTPQKSQPVPSPEPLNSRWLRTCKVEFATPYGTILGKRTLTDTGETFDSDKVRWTGNADSDRKLVMSLEWTHRINATPADTPETWGILTVKFTHQRKLPFRSLLRLLRPNHPTGSALTTAMMVYSSSDPAAETRIDLADLLPFAAGVDQLIWRAEALPRQGGVDRLYATGTLDMVTLRGAAQGIVAARAQLDAKAARFATDCERYEEEIVPDV